MAILKTIAVGFALTASLPAAAATTINFDQLPDGTTLPTSGTAINTQYASLGIMFLGVNTVDANTGPVNAWGLIQATGLGGSRNYLGNFGAITPSSPVPGPSDYLLAPRYDITSLRFTGTASGISFGLNTGGGQNTVTINAYDGSGTLLQTLAGVRANNGTFDVQTLTAAGVARLDIVGGFNGVGGSVRLYGIDNLTYTLTPVAAPVPEAATWAMMILGLGMTGAAARRHRTRVVFAD